MEDKLQMDSQIIFEEDIMIEGAPRLLSESLSQRSGTWQIYDGTG